MGPKLSGAMKRRWKKRAAELRRMVNRPHDTKMLAAAPPDMRRAITTGDKLRSAGVGTCEDLGTIHNRRSQGRVLAGDTSAWPTFCDAVAWGTVGHLGARHGVPRYRAQRAAYYALCIGELELAMTLAERLWAVQPQRNTDASLWHTENYPSGALLLRLWAKLEEREDEVSGSWVPAAELAGYAPILAAWDSGGTAFQDALALACDEHLRLTGVGSNRMEQDWFDDFCPVDIIGLARLHAYSRGEPMALPAHPLLEQPLGAIPSVLDEPSLRQHHELRDGVIARAHAFGLFPAVPSQRPGSSRWPPPPAGWTALPKNKPEPPDPPEPPQPHPPQPPKQP